MRGLLRRYGKARSEYRVRMRLGGCMSLAGGASIRSDARQWSPSRLCAATAVGGASVAAVDPALTAGFLLVDSPPT